MKAVLDTNVLISALLYPARAPAEILRAWQDRRFRLVTHAAQIDELKQALRASHLRVRIRRAEVGELVNVLRNHAERSGVLPVVRRSNDPRDDYLLALCEAAKADFLVTGDKADLLALKRHGQTRIFSVRAFADILGLKP